MNTQIDTIIESLDNLSINQLNSSIEYMEEITASTTKKKVLTEDLGKIFEKAICLLYEIEYNGKYKYSLDDAIKLKEKIGKLKAIYPDKLKHIAKNGNQCDFMIIKDTNTNTNNDEIKYLSAKTTKKNNKVCPQVIGQVSKKKFCEYFKIENATTYTLENIKTYIENNIIDLLIQYSNTTFDCPIIYYNQHKNTLQIIKLKTPIEWENYKIQFSHNIKNKKWNESSYISLANNTTSSITSNTGIGEFQIHNHRDCIKFRWSFNKLLSQFDSHFEIIHLSMD